MYLVKIDKRYRITIPKDLRKKLGIRPGDVLKAKIVGDEITLKVIKEDLPKRLQELLRDFEFNREVRRKAEKWLLEKS